MKRRGLTLIEVLASALILAMAAGALSTAARDAARASREARLTEAALVAFERWREETALGDIAAEQWRWRDDQGREWLVRQTPSMSADDTPIAWVELRVEMARGPTWQFEPALSIWRFRAPGGDEAREAP